MKIYTEEQVNKITLQVLTFGHYEASITPIELPSDDELEEISKHEILYNDSKRGWWLEGANYILNLIKLQYEKDN
jgi:hypothetical protein